MIGYDDVKELERTYLERASKEEYSQAAIDAYLEWHSAAVVYLNDFYSEDNSDYSKFKNVDNSGNGYVLNNIFRGLYSKYVLLMEGTKRKQENINAVDEKSPMVFISHSSRDKAFVEELVSLLEDLGLDESNLFCSSVDGFGIGLGENIFETLRNLFSKHKLFVIFVHSPRYYESAVSLNEMGAAWVLKTDFVSILTRDMEFGMMKGVVGSDKISIKVDASDAKSRLTELKGLLCDTFGMADIAQSKWERKRDKFLKSVIKL